MRYFIIEQLIPFILLYFVKVLVSEKSCSVVDTPSSVDMSSLALRTVSSDGVFEGRPTQTLLFQPSSDSSGLSQWNISFFVVTVFKGKTIPVSATVVVDVVDGADFLGETNVSCLLSKTPNDDLYVVFVNKSLSPLDRFYFSSGSFVRSSDQVVRQVKDFACAKCGLPIKVRLPKSLKVQEGAKLKLQCKTSGGGKPKIYWSKDGQALVFDKHVTLANRLGSALRIKNTHLADGGIYQCFASTALTNSSVASTKLMVLKAKFPDSIYGEPCQRQNYCLNKGRCYFLRTLGKKYCVCVKDFQGERCEEKQFRIRENVDSTVRTSGSSSLTLENLNETFVVCVIVIGSILLATIIILTFCIIRQCRRSRTKKPLRLVKANALDDQSPPSLPDGHQTIVDVSRLSCVLNQQSASDFDGMRSSAAVCFPGHSSLDRVQEEEPTMNVRPTRTSWTGLRQSNSQLPALTKEQKVLNRLSAASDDVTSRCQSWISGNRLSLNSDRLSYAGPQHSGERASVRQFPADRSNMGVTRPTAVNQTRDRLAAISATPESDLGLSQDHAEAANSVGTSYCLASESHDADDQMNGSAVTLEKNSLHHRSDMEVNFTSEADILGMEMSGDELNEGQRGRASRNFSELSIPTNDNRSMLTTDSEDSTLSISEDQALLRRLSEYPFINSNVFNRVGNIQGSGSDLSWDESADVPSFANPSLMYSGHS